MASSQQPTTIEPREAANDHGGVAEARPVRRGDFLHYSDEPLCSIDSVAQREISSYGDKPRGLWVSVKGPNDWQAWNRGEGWWRDTRKQALSRVHVRSEARLLRLGSAEELDAFTGRYGNNGPYGVAIGWERVAAEWQGIIIAPYIWARRLHDATRWYYGGDCASGCIWDADAISHAETLREPRRRRRAGNTPQAAKTGRDPSSTPDVSDTGPGRPPESFPQHEPQS